MQPNELLSNEYVEVKFLETEPEAVAENDVSVTKFLQHAPYNYGG